MTNKALYTIGHGSREPKTFVALLKQFDIQYLIDVRSTPYSKFNPQFNRNELSVALKSNNIKYVFMGDSIGGRPTDLSCYDEEGKVDYDVIKTRKFFLDGIERLKNAYLKGINVVLMCSESKPTECHRSKLIGTFLQSEKIDVMHIDENGNLRDQITVINEINKGLFPVDLFGNPIVLTSRKNYL